MKEFINWMADPIRSFPVVTLLYYLMMRYYRIVGTKKFAYISLAVLLPVVVWFCTDPNFVAIILWPDNIPINIIIVLIAWLTWYSLYRCAQNDERLEQGLTPIEATPENREKVWTWPNLVYVELMCMIGTTIFLVVWAIIFKAPLEEPANPTWAPNPAKAPWYFLGLQEMLVYFDPWMAGVVLPGLIVVGLLAVPYIDTNPKGNGYFTIAERKMAMWFFMFGWLVLWIYLIIVGTFLRGPNWTFYGPFEFWDFHKVVAEYNVNLSEFVWVKWLNMPMPHNMIVREFLGIILTAVYVVVLPPLSATTKWGKKLIGDMGKVRYYIFIFLLLGMTSLPIKMVLRWLFSLKYIIALPELELSL
ncbi:cytochrome B(C-terminal)/b6/PetD [Bacteriovorax sp. BSW11_IV]|uniref:cytochrome B(C-terminal)/b6/PetD n=1 Tax=Bacteriovorax sp. BSW11_IV TaxID=1353529 RepID=UPI00038A2889|nr:cytochrome B(C-terminal)/b6/PetD [Bacteriovorax sp. BSW11_IV]EQC47070.1 cytochrome B(C-terminal)/b6/PetD [Bacteriovorax sp. BSW11_IV]